MYFSIEGVIGVGKTTLARLLQPAFNAVLPGGLRRKSLPEQFLPGPRPLCLPDPDVLPAQPLPPAAPRRAPDAWPTGKSLISDYTFEKDALFARINLIGDELEMYYRLHEALAEKIPVPDLMVYLRASTDTLMQRIALRDRPYERQMERGYIDQLNQAYDSFFPRALRRSPRPGAGDRNGQARLRAQPGRPALDRRPHPEWADRGALST